MDLNAIYLAGGDSKYLRFSGLSENNRGSQNLTIIDPNNRSMRDRLLILDVAAKMNDHEVLDVQGKSNLCL